MGAGQSSAAQNPEQGGKTSYYELLGVERQATEEEVKKAYRRKALQLHPDRNHGDEEQATTVFAEVQAAYEVLSDPQERAWYDSHESAILRGDNVGDDDEAVPTYENIRATSADDLARIVGKFNKNVEFTDAPSGFFGFVRETFERLAKEEQIASSLAGTPFPEYPTFGHKDDLYEDVPKLFYSAWTSYSTMKDFSWKDRYRLSEAPDRWYRRRMEQENKKFRQDGIREFNDAVRSLVAFVRKRDPRYVPSTQTEAERQKVLRDAATAQAARARAENEAKLNAEVPEWTQSREPDPLAEMEGTFDEESEAEHVFECVACNKIFKSEMQWEAHEKSKKHQKAVYALQKKMRKDNANLDLSAASSRDATPDFDTEYDDDDPVDRVETEAAADETRVIGDDQHDEKSDKEAAGDIRPGPEDLSADQGDGEQKSAEADVSSEESDSADEDYASPETIAARLASSHLDSGLSTPGTTTDADEGTSVAADGASEAPTGKKLGAAAKKRAKKAAAAATDDSETSHPCAGCDKSYATKTRLFQHLKDHPEHAALKPASGKKKGRGRK
ncbi:hypothetical protein LTR86_006563 [Recurvomyces mirabilis]|nr:hypothetical protein LTR86_006563 [Recurvomyces mirabilis]